MCGGYFRLTDGNGYCLLWMGEKQWVFFMALACVFSRCSTNSWQERFNTVSVLHILLWGLTGERIFYDHAELIQCVGFLYKAFGAQLDCFFDFVGL